MRAKLMTSAAVLLGVLAFATVTEAQSFNGGGGGGGGNDDPSTKVEGSYNSNSGNDNSDHTKVDDSFNDNSKNFTDNSNHTKIEDSGNDNSKNYTDDSYNTDNSNHQKADDSYNTDNSNHQKADDSYNTDNSSHQKIDDSYNTDNSSHMKVDDSFNTDNSNHTKIEDSYNTANWNIRVSLTNQDLDASVSHVKFDLSEDDRGNQNGRLRSGDISQSGGAFAGFAGIQTVSNNTGMASIGQAATAVSANANVTFGNGGGQ